MNGFTVLSSNLTNDLADELVVMPLGAGQEVGRSCILLTFKGRNILLDCGIHPGMTGVDALPFVDLVDCEKIDLLLITHFHLDHCGALPWFLQKTSFRGRCFMTHATKAIYRLILSDYVKVSNINVDQMLYTEAELEASMDKIELIDFREQKEVNGILFKCYVAGHVLGACMFMIEIAGVRILYTGDFSRLEDRHLCAAEMPELSPDVLIVESTYGTQVHENRIEREKRFRSVVRNIVSRGGRCLIPAFALGRAQELLLILDELWASREELQHIPIYYASSLAKRCMSIYQTFVSGMNTTIQRQIAVGNPFNFRFVRYLPSAEKFVDPGPCVVLASPGMLQNGLSRELFESWCSEVKNGCIIAGYCVEGTLAKHILTEPDEVVSLSGQKLSVRMDISYISFSAHTDFQQTSEFIRLLKPKNVIFVHGESNEMMRLRASIERQFTDNSDVQLTTYCPRNTEEVKLYITSQEKVKILGTLDRELAETENGMLIEGIVVKQDFSYALMDVEQLPKFTELATCEINQRLCVHYDAQPDVLVQCMQRFTGDEVRPLEIDDDGYCSVYLICDCIRMILDLPVVVLEWKSDTVTDVVSKVLASIIQVAAFVSPRELEETNNYRHQTDRLIDLLEGMVDEDAIEQQPGTDQLTVYFDDVQVQIDLDDWSVECSDYKIHDMLTSCIGHLKRSLQLNFTVPLSDESDEVETCAEYKSDKADAVDSDSNVGFSVKDGGDQPTIKPEPLEVKKEYDI